MKRLFFITIIIQLFVMTSCAQTTEETTEKTTNKTQGHPELLTMETFKQKVFDFEANKEWKYEGQLPAIVDFYADWCRPCRMVAPIMEELAKEYEGKIVIYKVDTQSEQQLSAMLGIQSLPSILFIPAEGQPQMAVGALPKETFKEHIKTILKVE